MRGGDKGRDFDSQWDDSYRRAQGKAAKGQGPWSEDKYLERINARPKPAHHAKDGDSCVSALALLGGIAWAISEVISRAH